MTPKGRSRCNLLSLTEQWASIGQRRFHFREGETIHTESSRILSRKLRRARRACGLARVAGLGGRQAPVPRVRGLASARAVSALTCHLAGSPQNHKPPPPRARRASCCPPATAATTTTSPPVPERSLSSCGSNASTTQSLPRWKGGVTPVAPGVGVATQTEQSAVAARHAR